MKGNVPIWGWVVLGLALLASFGLDFANMTQGGAIDLRNRITGERLLMQHIDAYHYKWDDTQPPEFCDPFNNPRIPISKTTASPTLLLLHLPFALLPYGAAQMLWLLTQWLLLLGTMWLWLRRCTMERQRLLVALVVAGFTFTSAWRLHAERGQAYVLLLFLFAGWLSLTLDAKKEFLTGMLAGFLVALRPPFLLLAPYLALHRRGQLTGMVVGLLLGLGLPMLWESHCWPDYFSAMQSGSSYYRNQDEPRPGPHSYPAEIEGIPTLKLGKFVAIPFADFSFFAFMRSLGFGAPPAFPLLLLATIPFGLWLWFSRRAKQELLLPGLVAWLFLIDLFLPAFRSSYNDVMILNVIMLGVIGMKKIQWTVWPCLLALPLGWYVYFAAPQQAGSINLPTLFFTIGAVLALFLFTNRANPSKV